MSARKQANFRLDTDLLEALKAQARFEGVDATDIVTKAIARYLADPDESTITTEAPYATQADLAELSNRIADRIAKLEAEVAKVLTAAQSRPASTTPRTTPIAGTYRTEPTKSAAVPESESEVTSAEILPKLPDLHVQTPQKYPTPVVEASSGVRGDRPSDPKTVERVEVGVKPGDEKGISQKDLCLRLGMTPIKASNIGRDIPTHFGIDSKTYLERATGWRLQGRKWYPPNSD